ncbi:MAG TPA: hypothetical protein VMU97_01240 [Candidatus Dormibacteraeota bacterium]|nr:hypothetical protein [Candidatus Dormibacteraeota bacterium]
MPARPERPQPDRTAGRITAGSLEGELFAQQEGWKIIAMEDQDFATQAIVRAHRLRRATSEDRIDTGDAYLKGMTDLRARQLLVATAAAHDQDSVGIELQLFDPDA